MTREYEGSLGLFEAMLDSDLRFLLFKKHLFLEKLAAESLDNRKRCGVWGSENKEVITVEVWPLLYNDDSLPNNELIRFRHLAIKTIFMRWTNAGYNIRHAKDPFKSKAFMKYLDDLGFDDADFVVFEV